MHIYSSTRHEHFYYVYEIYAFISLALVCVRVCETILVFTTINSRNHYVYFIKNKK